MTKLRVIAVCAFIALFAGVHMFPASSARADGPLPGARLANGAAPAFTFSFYERTTNQPGTGSPTDTGPIVALPNSVGPGYVVIMDCGNPTVAADRNNVSDWSDVLHFIDSGEGARTAQLLSAGGAMCLRLPRFWPTPTCLCKRPRPAPGSTIPTTRCSMPVTSIMFTARLAAVVRRPRCRKATR